MAMWNEIGGERTEEAGWSGKNVRRKERDGREDGETGRGVGREERCRMQTEVEKIRNT